MTKMKIMFLLLSFFTICTVFSFSQNVNIMTDTIETEEDPEPTVISFPIGATGGIKPNKADEPANGGAIMGLQIGKKNNYFLSILFNYSGTKKIAGEQSSFGSFILNPSTEGSSFTLSGNKLMTIPGTKILFGFSGRLGVSFTEWEVTNTEGTEAHNGSLLYLVPGVILVSNEMDYGDTGKFQVGLEVGLGIRKIIGDLSQADEFISRDEVLGVSRTSFSGLEATIFLRLNNVKPFIRITLYPEKYGIKGFSGFQAYLGFDLIAPLFKDRLK